MNTNTYAMVMAGGGGTRFWPRSRRRRPKQFLTLVGERTLLQQAVERLEALAPPQQTWIITTSEQVPLVAEQLHDIAKDQIVGEPFGRDTAACIGLGAALIARQSPNAIILVTPADHIIQPLASFHRTLNAAVQLAEERPDALITLGIPPQYPATGYGYIQQGEALPGRNGIDIHRIAKFKEKPDYATAEKYLQSGAFFWNSGLFVWRAAAILKEIQRLEPALHAALHRIAHAWDTPERAHVFRQEYEALQRISIDHAVMEHAQESYVLRAAFQWDDVGSWPALQRHHPQDASGNTVLGTRHLGLNSRHCIVAGDDAARQLIATVGVEHLLVVRDGDVILVADHRDEAGIKQLVEQLKQQGLEAFL